MFASSKAESSDFLPGLTRSFVELDVNSPLPTQQFTEACLKVMPIFDHIGEQFSGPGAHRYDPEKCGDPR